MINRLQASNPLNRALLILVLSLASAVVGAKELEPIVGEPVVRFAVPEINKNDGLMSAEQPAQPTLSETETQGQQAAAAQEATGVETPAGVSALTLAAGERLSASLRQWLQSQRMELSWEASGSMPSRMRDVVIERAWAAPSSDLVQTLTEVLSPFGLSAQIDATTQTVIVRNASSATP